MGWKYICDLHDDDKRSDCKLIRYFVTSNPDITLSYDLYLTMYTYPLRNKGTNDFGTEYTIRKSRWCSSSTGFLPINKHKIYPFLKARQKDGFYIPRKALEYAYKLL